MQGSGLPDPRGIGVGIAYGPVIIGNIGTVIGDSVNTASRLEAACKDFGRRLIVSEAVYEKLEKPYQERLTPLGEVPLKGKAGCLPVYGI